jgi:acyl carrier protein
VDIHLPIRAFLQRHFRHRTIADNDDLFASGFATSLFAIELVTFLERQFAIRIESADLDIKNFRSIDALSALVMRKLSLTTAAVEESQ